MQKLRGYLGILGFILFIGAMLNFAAFMLVAADLGGTNAKEDAGRYYLTDHAKRTEVSRRVWTYSKAHQRSVEITQPIGIFVGGGLMVYALWGTPSRRSGQ